MIRRPGSALAVLALVGVLNGSPVTASADSTGDYPIPRRMIATTCTAEQYLAAVRDTEPVYFERYMIDKSNKPLHVQRAAIDRARWFFSLDPAGRRAYSENLATNVFYEQLAFAWPNWAKIFFNNKGVVAYATDVCDRYPPEDASVWHWVPTP